MSYQSKPNHYSMGSIFCHNSVLIYSLLVFLVFDASEQANSHSLLLSYLVKLMQHCQMYGSQLHGKTLQLFLCHLYPECFLELLVQLCQ